MHLAISTASFGKDTTRSVARAAALGFDWLEVNLQQDEFGYGYRRKTNARFYRQLGQTIKESGLRVWSVTSLPLTQEQMFFERARKDILLSSAIAAGLLGAHVYVLRPADVFTTEIAFETYVRESKAPAVIEGFDEAWVQAVNRRITVALRNHDHWVGAPLSNQPERMAKLTDDLAVGWAMDVRRALQRGKLDKWMEAAGERLAVAYLYDFADGRYTPPLDPVWQQWLPALAETNLKCAIIHAPDMADEAQLQESRDYLSSLLEASPAS